MMKKIYTATMTNTGGRTGKVAAPDDSLSLAIAGPGDAVPGATNPEQLFAAGFSSCFNGALALVLRQEHIKADSTITAEVTLYEQGPHDYVLGVNLKGHIEGQSKEKTQELLEKAHLVCPYSKATRGNIEVSLEAV